MSIVPASSRHVIASASSSFRLRGEPQNSQRSNHQLGSSASSHSRYVSPHSVDTLTSKERTHLVFQLTQKSVCDLSANDIHIVKSLLASTLLADSDRKSLQTKMNVYSELSQGSYLQNCRDFIIEEEEVLTPAAASASSAVGLIPETDEIQLTVDTTSDHFTAGLSDGNAVVVWTKHSDLNDANEYNIYGRITNKFGQLVGDVFPVIETKGYQGFPLICVFSDGFLVVWGGGGIGMGQLFTNDGTPVGSPAIINLNGSGISDLRPLPNGGFAALISANNRYHIQKFSSSLVPDGDPLFVGDILGYYAFAVLSQDRVVVVRSHRADATSSTFGNIPDDVFGRLYSLSDGTPITGDFRILSPCINSPYYEKIFA